MPAISLANEAVHWSGSKKQESNTQYAQTRLSGNTILWDYKLYYKYAAIVVAYSSQTNWFG